MFEPYPKIVSLHPRNEITHKFIEDIYTAPELEYLKDNQWVWTEKVDGTNIRVMWDGSGICFRGRVRFSGRTENAQISSKLFHVLDIMFPQEALEEHFPTSPICLYGEGFGAGIQKGGGNYLPSMSFVLFDVMIDGWWLKRKDVVDVAYKLGISSTLGIATVPIVGRGTLREAEELVKSHTLKSTWGDFEAEGLVLRPDVELCARGGARIITKLKGKDFE
jgi:hypothetical protein